MTQVTKPMAKNKIVRISQSPDSIAESTGLAAYGMAKLPNSMHIVQPQLDDENRWITGIDEHAAKVRAIADPVRQKEIREKIYNLRIALQQKLGISDLSGTSSYWDTFLIDLGSLTMLDRDNAKHELIYRVITANNHIMPNSLAKDTPEHWDTKFMAFNPEYEAGNANASRDLLDESIANIRSLKADSERLYLIARLCLGKSIKKDLGTTIIYDLLRKFLDANVKENPKVFAKYYEMDLEELTDKHDIKEAIRYGIITYRNNQYMRGNISLGRTEIDIEINLKTPEFNSEFNAIRQELHNRSKVENQ